jgi:ATP-dependent helicase/nuclease subunit A
MSTQWTKSQKKAIGRTRGPTLVSAAAGSGKTAVLTERCVHLVTKGRARNRIDELLVVTFTEAAAAEMRSRIGERLREAAQEAPDDPHIARQLSFVDRADICTLHSFCSKLLRTHFAQIGLDPNFVILDDDEAALLRQEAIEAVFDENYEAGSGRADAISNFAAHYGGGQDEQAMEYILELHRLLCSVANPNGWRAKARERIRCEGDNPPTELLKLHRGQIVRRLGELIFTAQRSERYFAAEHPHREKYVERLDPVRSSLESWTKRLAGNEPLNLDRIKEEIASFKFPSIPRLPRDAPDDQKQRHEKAKKVFASFREEFQGGLQKTLCRFSHQDYAEGLRASEPYVELMLDLVEQFDLRYAALKEDGASLDFNDLERYAIKLLTDDADSRTPSEAARKIREQFRQVLVDEFQDINPLQAKILQLVGGDDGRNFFCVGDVKQSIYRFRLADPSIFADMRRRLGSADGSSLVELRENFRSRSTVIDAVNLLFSSLMSGQLDDVEYAEGDRMTPGVEYPPSGERPVEMHLIHRDPRREREESDDDDDALSDLDLDRLEREALFIGARIKEMIDGGETVCERSSDNRLIGRPIRYRDIVILLRSPKNNANTISRTLQRMGVPVHADLATGFFESAEARDVLNLLQILDNPRQDMPLATTMRGPFGRFSESDLLAIRLHDRSEPFHEVVHTYAVTGSDVHIRRRVSEFIALLARWRDWCKREELPSALWGILQESNYTAYVSGLNAGAQRRANLMKFHEIIRKFNRFARHGLPRFLEFVDSLRQADQDIGAAPGLNEADDVVRIMSVHRSKGLEFPVVFVAHLGKRFNMADARSPIVFDRDYHIGILAADPDHYSFYPTIAHQLASDRIRDKTLAEEMRIMYVAMTRARERLILVGDASESEMDRWQSVSIGEPNGLSSPSESRRARSAMDWLLPILFSLENKGVTFEDGDAADAVIVVKEHGTQEAPPESIGGRGRDESTARFQSFSILAPFREALDDLDEDLERIKTKLFANYPFETLTATPAVQSITQLKGRLEAPLDPTHRDPVIYTTAREWSKPAFLKDLDNDSNEPAPTQRGAAIHRVLQNIDLRLTYAMHDLTAQVESMVQRGSLSAEDARQVDLNSLVWLFNSDLGHRLRNSRQAHREIAFITRLPIDRLPDFTEPDVHSDDYVLVRGVIDVVVEGPDGLIIADYKTDRRTTGVLDQYREQVDRYAEAISAAWRLPISERWLAFLTRRELIKW